MSSAAGEGLHGGKGDRRIAGDTKIVAVNVDGMWQLHAVGRVGQGLKNGPGGDAPAGQYVV